MQYPELIQITQEWEIVGEMKSGFQEILTLRALQFLAGLEKEFGDRRRRLLQLRRQRQAEINAGKWPAFLPETAPIREADWKVAPIPPDLQDRRVEITGPVDRKMIINALNSGANVFMADFEDSTAPTWRNVVQGQMNLRDAVRRTIAYTSPEGKHYRLKSTVATLMVRPRGWHLEEKHVRLNGKAISAALFDFGLFFFHNAHALLERGTGPYFYLPKLENHLEARLWNEVFDYAQDALGIPRGTIRATVLIENILAAFEMDEILYELKDHSAGLNCGRWDYIFSFIKTFREFPECVLPDRAQVTMTTHFMRSYSRLLIQTCHRRGAHAMGGMAAQIPIKNDPLANEQALEKVRFDKEREVNDGHDGTWVAHPGLVPVAKAVFDEKMPTPNQIHRSLENLTVTEKDLLQVPQGDITEDGLRTNINVAIQYLEAWLRGVGCVPINHLMEDAATAEISRAQLWQWIRNRVPLNDGRVVTRELYQKLVPQELEKIRHLVGQARFRNGKFELATQLLNDLSTSQVFEDFLTLVAYNHL